MRTKFKQLLKKKGIPVKDTAELCSVSTQMIYYWREYGVRNWKTAVKLAKKLKCKPEDIIGDE